jgi:hypothetical protein
MRVCSPISLTYFGKGDEGEKPATAIKLSNKMIRNATNGWCVLMESLQRKSPKRNLATKKYRSSNASSLIP